MKPIIECKKLNFQNRIHYPPIEIERDRITFICGESGCGKSTLLKLFNATVSPSEGEIVYDGRPLDSMDSVALRKEVLLVSQNVFLFDGTVEENFRQYYAYRELPPLSPEQMRKYLSICCADFDLSANCVTMSGGERQRVFIAICLSLKPKVLMLDEPTSALDEATAGQFFSNLRDFCGENAITLLVVSHDKSLAARFADTVIPLEKEAKP